MPVGTVALDFGAFPGSSDTSIVVTGQTFIGTASSVSAYLAIANSADHSADEHLLETIKVAAGNIVAGVGFTIYGVNTSQLNEPLQRPGVNQTSPPRITETAESVGGIGTRIYGQWLVTWVWV